MLLWTSKLCAAQLPSSTWGTGGDLVAPLGRLSLAEAMRAAIILCVSQVTLASQGPALPAGAPNSCPPATPGARHTCGPAHAIADGPGSEGGVGELRGSAEVCAAAGQAEGRAQPLPEMPSFSGPALHQLLCFRFVIGPHLSVQLRIQTQP